jgi:16S rRNA processing protein RimM
MQDSPVWENLVAIGRVARPQGRRGEVAVDLLTDFPERFARLERVYVEGEPGGRSEPLDIEAVREQGGRPIVKFRGVAGIDEASSLAGRELRLPEDELQPLPSGSFYHFQVHGLPVWARGQEVIGVVEAVWRTGGTDLLVVRSREGREILIPLCAEICRKIDIEGGRIEIDPPEGLLTLNAD